MSQSPDSHKKMELKGENFVTLGTHLSEGFPEMYGVSNWALREMSLENVFVWCGIHHPSASVSSVASLEFVIPTLLWMGLFTIS